MHRIISILIVLCTLLISSCRGDIVVAVLTTTDEQKNEASALCKILNNQQGITAKIISPSEKLSGYDVLWYQRLDCSAISQLELDSAKPIRKYLENGGQLVLSMDAVRLLNAWGIESQPIETYTYDCVDDGFGRKLGFHAYRSHPIFDKMYGGAYPWHGTQDNTCRLLGFTGSNMPAAEGTQIIATQWEYIFNRPDKKIIWQSPIGKGRVLAIGGCLYYDRANFHKSQLAQFTANVVRYLGGAGSEDKERYWDYSPVSVEYFPNNIDGDFSAVYSPIEAPAPKAQQLALTEPKYSLSREAHNQYATLATPHAMLIAQEGGGIDEIWTHPIMSLRDYRAWLYLEGEKDLVSLASCPCQFEIHPHAIIRRYTYKDLSITETITSDIDTPTVVVNYAWEGKGLKSIITDFKSNLRYMWPYDADALGSLYYTWSPSLNAVVVKDKNAEFASIIGSNMTARVMLLGRYGEISYIEGEAMAKETDMLQISGALIYDVEHTAALDIVMAAGATGEEQVLRNYSSALEAPAAIAERSAAYYTDYLANITTISSPDSLFNEALLWAQISAAQFLVETPGLGRGLMAGYSSSRRGWGGGHRVSGRPGYAWYFGRDAAWASMAFDAMGDFKTVRSSLQLMIDHQECDGKIYHELTSSGFTHFDASDSTPLMVILMAHYLRASGDIDFVKNNYAAIQKAMDYCYSTDYDGDGIIEINHVGHGWLEGGALFGSQTEFYLAGTWRKALESAAELAKACGKRSEQVKYQEDADKLYEAIEGFWNEERGYYNYALNEDDTYQDEFLSLTAVPVYFNVVDPERAQKMSKLYSSPKMSTDWGVRTILEDTDYGEFGAYSPRHVWPLFTGWATLAEYKTGHYYQGFTSLYNNLANYRGFALGRIAEVINGDGYRNNGITCHQCWSETMAILPAIEGLLGFEPDALNNSVKLAPALPFDWPSLKVTNLKVADASLNMEVSKSKGKYTYKLSSTEPLFAEFTAILPAMSDIVSVKVGKSDPPYKIVRDCGYVKLIINCTINEDTTIEVNYLEGVSFLPAVKSEHKALEASEGFRVLDQRIEDGLLYIDLAGRPGSSHKLRMYMPGSFISSYGTGHILYVGKDIYQADINFEASDELYVTKTIGFEPLLK